MNDITVTVIVRSMGTGQGGSIPYKLDELLSALNDARLEVPAEYRGSIEVDCEPSYEFGEHYARMQITYERPENEKEKARRIVDEQRHWDAQLAQAQERVEYCKRQRAERA